MFDIVGQTISIAVHHGTGHEDAARQVSALSADLCLIVSVCDQPADWIKDGIMNCLLGWQEEAPSAHTIAHRSQRILIASHLLKHNVVVAVIERGCQGTRACTDDVCVKDRRFGIIGSDLECAAHQANPARIETNTKVERFPWRKRKGIRGTDRACQSSDTKCCITIHKLKPCDSESLGSGIANRSEIFAQPPPNRDILTTDVVVSESERQIGQGADATAGEAQGGGTAGVAGGDLESCCCGAGDRWIKDDAEIQRCPRRKGERPARGPHQSEPPTGAVDGETIQLGRICPEAHQPQRLGEPGGIREQRPEVEISRHQQTLIVQEGQVGPWNGIDLAGGITTHPAEPTSGTGRRFVGDDQGQGLLGIATVPIDVQTQFEGFERDSRLETKRSGKVKCAAVHDVSHAVRNGEVGRNCGSTVGHRAHRGGHRPGGCRRDLWHIRANEIILECDLIVGREGRAWGDRRGQHRDVACADGAQRLKCPLHGCRAGGARQG